MLNELQTIFTQSGDWLLPVSSTLLALSVFITVMLLLKLPYGRDNKEQDQLYDYDQLRYGKLREESGTFRLAEPLVMEFTNLNQHSARIASIQEMLNMSDQPLPWTPEEYLGVRQTEAFLISIPFGIFAWNYFHPIAGIVFGGFVFLGYYYLQINELSNVSQKRKFQIRTRLPFVIDMMALTRSAGASFNQSLEIAANESKDHPAGDELSEVLRQLYLGRTQHQALTEFADRMRDEDVSDIVFAINKAEELGTPIADALSEMADQMRLKKSQWGEKASAEAQVKMSFPGMLIMLACLLVIISPFILQAVTGTM